MFCWAKRKGLQTFIFWREGCLFIGFPVFCFCWAFPRLRPRPLPLLETTAWFTPRIDALLMFWVDEEVLILPLPLPRLINALCWFCPFPVSFPCIPLPLPRNWPRPRPWPLPRIGAPSLAFLARRFSFLFSLIISSIEKDGFRPLYQKTIICKKKRILCNEILCHYSSMIVWRRKKISKYLISFPTLKMISEIRLQYVHFIALLLTEKEQRKVHFTRKKKKISQ